MARQSNTIQKQVKLPFSVALEVVLQGIRIRMGRSIVTMMGVVLGVAFLMSVFCANAIRAGMSEEEEIRREVGRMTNFLQADAGAIEGRTFGIVSSGRLNPVEERLIAHLHREGAGRILFFQTEGGGLVPSHDSLETRRSPKGLGNEASALVLIGEGPLPDFDWHGALGGMVRKVVAATRSEHLANIPVGAIPVRLERKLRPEEAERLEREAEQAKIRNIWIVSIALLVTVIGITNSLLMSVTERFKEIGTMKCLGALSSFIRRIFFIESALTGLVGSLIGGVLGFFVAAVIYAFTFGFGLVFFSIDYGSVFVLYTISVVCGIAMSILAAIYPASFASRMIPATALRTNI